MVKMTTSNAYIAELMRKVATVYLLTDKNRFRIIAYQKAADAIEMLNTPLKSLWEKNQLNTIEGLGTTIRGHIDEYFRQEEDSYLVKAIKEIPVPVFELMKVPGIGPKKAYKLVQVLKLAKAKDIFVAILKAAREDRISVIDSFGVKSQADIIEGISLYGKTAGKPLRLLLAHADAIAGEVTAYLKSRSGVESVHALGSLRRRTGTVGDIDIAVVAKKDSAIAGIIDHFTKHPQMGSIESKGREKSSIILDSGVRVDLRIGHKNSFGAMLQYFTGSKAHNIELREFALKKRLSLSEYGIKKIQKSKIKNQNQISKIKTFKTEKEFYNFLGLPLIPPELREGRGEITLAKANKIPDLIELEDVRGDMQIHTNYNLEPSHDLGQNAVQEILQKADSLGYGYVAFTDHNPSISKHSEDEIVQIMRTRKEFIQKTLNKTEYRCKYFISLEVDIRPDGTIALPNAALEYVDFILVSIHSSFRMTREEMTSRLLKAFSYPKVKILAHPTARLIGKRDGIDADWEEIFNECRKRRIALEINGSPSRMDLPDTLVQQAKEIGCVFTFGTDSHAVEQMDCMNYAVSVARRGWLEKKDLLNALSCAEIKSFLTS